MRRDHVERSICRGEYPPPPLLRGKTLGYALPGVVVLFALARRRRRKLPWADHGAKLAAAAIVVTCAGVLALARSPFTAMLVTAAALLLVGLLQRLFFVGAVKDGALPTVFSFFHSDRGVLERVPDASYREPARVAVLRLAPRSRRAFALVIGGVVMLALFGACAGTMMLAERSASISAG